MSALTSEALSQLGQLNNQGGLPSPPSSQNNWETDSDCSYYSLSELRLDKSYRQIPARQVREQARKIPAGPISSQSTYPRQFYNKEELALQSLGPWKEYPFCLNRYVAGLPGPVRMITNSAAPGEIDVVYHPGRTEHSDCLAKYRPKGYHKGAVPTPLPSRNPWISSPSGGFLLRLDYQPSREITPRTCDFAVARARLVLGN
ncbi:hypothetical protein FAGAP_4132 [Fusarium agapanthi]|uniref:Uncharacterized protein n=1 Tax=Fusarium agapanthi TaxID=1803897 RepID=A0A9P5BJA2_9HYPO|nr:hypothetical protein FAGAP_4132 [Fusarium agapanthi]